MLIKSIKRNHYCPKTAPLLLLSRNKKEGGKAIKLEQNSSQMIVWCGLIFYLQRIKKVFCYQVEQYVFKALQSSQNMYHLLSPLYSGSAQSCFLPFALQWIHYYGSNKSTGLETGKLHLCGVVRLALELVQLPCSESTVLLLRTLLYKLRGFLAMSKPTNQRI